MSKKEKYRPPYPLIACDAHKGDPLPGYAVCVHVMDHGAKPAILDRTTREELGIIVCTECLSLPALPVKKMVTVCAHSVQTRFGVPL